jgi:hypothetical protein
MLVELIATIAAGLGAAGVVLLLGRVSGGRLPRWTVPVGAGAAMLAVTITNEYAWFERTRAALPEGVVVATTQEAKAVYRPWTYLEPYVDRFAAVDRASIRTHPERPGQRIVNLLFYGRWSQPRQVPVVVDCKRDRRAVLSEAARFGENGAIGNVRWRPVGPDDPIQTAACADAAAKDGSGARARAE